MLSQTILLAEVATSRCSVEAGEKQTFKAESIRELAAFKILMSTWSNWGNKNIRQASEQLCRNIESPVSWYNANSLFVMGAVVQRMHLNRVWLRKKISSHNFYFFLTTALTGGFFRHETILLLYSNTLEKSALWASLHCTALPYRQRVSTEGNTGLLHAVPVVLGCFLENDPSKVHVQNGYKNRCLEWFYCTSTL